MTDTDPQRVGLLPGEGDPGLEDQDRPPLETEPRDEVEVEPEGAGRSLMDRLRARQRAGAEDIEHELAIPFYNDELVAIYTHMDVKELDKIGKRVVGQFPKNEAARVLWGSADTLIFACKEIGTREGGDGEFVPLSVHMGLAEPVRYDLNLAQFMAFPSPGRDLKAREVIFLTFCQKDAAIIQQQMELAAWMSGVTEGLTESLVGEM